MDRYTFKVTIKDSKPSIWRTISLPANSDFEHFHFIIQAAFCLSGIFDFRFVKDPHKPSFECLRFSPEDDEEMLLADGCKDAEKTLLKDFFATNDSLRYDSGEWTFDIKLTSLRASGFPYALVEKGEGKIVYEMCGGIYGQLMAQEALTKYPDAPIAQLARKLLKKKKNAKIDFSFTDKDHKECNRTIHNFEEAILLMPLDDWDDDVDYSAREKFMDDEFLNIISGRTLDSKIGEDDELLN